MGPWSFSRRPLILRPWTVGMALDKPGWIAYRCEASSEEEEGESKSTNLEKNILEKTGKDKKKGRGNGRLAAPPPKPV
ncbi:hypothetical protein LIER_41115 [Lithospermum erythrorhizon]|uniref:Uncharacterized protein n=1 Tax=Lithospermum erythrorhizon TaxID=34254 RepID=A0AAV3R7E2_LITER